jgi:hypothetical protein
MERTSSGRRLFDNTDSGNGIWIILFSSFSFSFSRWLVVRRALLFGVGGGGKTMKHQYPAAVLLTTYLPSNQMSKTSE